MSGERKTPLERISVHYPEWVMKHGTRDEIKALAGKEEGLHGVAEQIARRVPDEDL